MILRKMLLLVGVLLVGPTVADQWQLSAVKTVQPYELIEILDQNVKIEAIEGESPAAAQMIQQSDRLIVSLKPGRYLVYGKGGAGLVICQESIADKVVTVPTTPEQPPEERMIWFLTRPICPPCDQWKATEADKLRNAGVKVITDGTLADRSGYTTPAFIIPRGDGSGKLIQSYQTAEQLLAVMSDLE